MAIQLPYTEGFIPEPSTSNGESKSNKGQANGYAPLDANAKVPLANLPPPTTHNSSHATGGTDALTPADIGASATGHTHSISDVTGLQTAIDNSGIKAGVQWTDRHTTSTGNPYVVGSIVYYNGRIYRCIAENDSILPQQGGNDYWADLGVGYLLPNENPKIVGGSINTSAGAVTQGTYETGDPENPFESETSFAGGNGGTITLKGGDGGFDRIGGGIGGNSGSINLSGYTGLGGDGHGGHGGSITLIGGYDSARAGSINLSAGSGGNHGGSIISTGNGDYRGGTLNMSGGSRHGGSINTSSGGSINTSDRGGSINTSGQGGSIDTSGTIEGQTTLTAGGSITTKGGRVPSQFDGDAGNGGLIDTSGGDGSHDFDDNPINGRDGGSIVTSNGGGSIDTRGFGSIQLGVFGTRTTLVGSASGTNKTITLPNASGTIALTSNVQTIFTLGGEAKTYFANNTSYLYGCMPTRGPQLSGSYTSAVLKILGNFTVTGISIHQYLPSAATATLTYQLVRVTNAFTFQGLGTSVVVVGNNNLTTTTSSMPAGVFLNNGDHIGLMLTLGASGAVPVATAATTILANIYCVPR